MAGVYRGMVDDGRALLDALATPYDHDRDQPAFTAPVSDGRPYRTFCGT